MNVRLFSFVATVCLAAPVFGKVEVGQVAPALVLKDVNDSTFALSHPRTKPLVLIFTTKDLGDYSLAWHDSIHAHMPDVQMQSVLDLGDVSRWLRGVARRRIQAKKSKAVIDWDGRVSRTWRGEDRSQVVLVGLSPDNVVRFILVGNPTPDNVQKAIEAIRAMP